MSGCFACLSICMYSMYVCYDLNTHFAKVMAITVHVCMMCVFTYFLYQICFLHIVAWFSHPSAVLGLRILPSLENAKIQGTRVLNLSAVIDSRVR